MLALNGGIFSAKDLQRLAAALSPLLDDLRKSPATDVEAPCHTATFDAPTPEPYLEPGAQECCLVADDEGRFYTMPPRLLEEATYYKKDRRISPSILNIARMLDPLSVQRYFAYDRRIEDLADELLSAARDGSDPVPRRGAVLRLLERFAREYQTPR